MTPRLFALHRTRDETGVSGTGVVAYGTQYPNGKCTLSWETGLASVAVYDSIDLVERIHGHNGSTQVVWLADYLGDLAAAVHRALELIDEYDGPELLDRWRWVNIREVLEAGGAS